MESPWWPAASLFQSRCLVKESNIRSRNPHQSPTLLRIPVSRLRGTDFIAFKHLCRISAQVETQEGTAFLCNRTRSDEIHRFITRPGQKLSFFTRIRHVSWQLWRPATGVDGSDTDGLLYGVFWPLGGVSPTIEGIFLTIAPTRWLYLS